MLNNKPKITTIGLVLSSVPRYSETFFRNKIKGLQNNGLQVVLFVDYINPDDFNFNCKVVAANNFGKGGFKSLWYSFLAIINSVFLHPKRSHKLYQLNKKDGLSLKENCKNLILNQFFLAEDVDWLHFGFGMLAVGRENVAATMKAKMAVSFRGFDLYLSPLKHPGCFDLLFQKNIRYHVLSQEMQQTLIDYKIFPNNIHVITPAIDTDFFKSNNKTNINKEVQLITVARLHWKKGLEYTLEALSYIKKYGITFHYTIIGVGNEKERLVFAAHQLGILDNITFTGKLPHEKVKIMLEKASIYIQYSIQEGFCNAVLEAQALGLLCVVSNAEGLCENVLDGKTGWVVPKRKPKLLAEKIIEIINLSDDKKQQIRNNAVARIQKEFHLRKQNELFLNFYLN